MEKRKCIKCGEQRNGDEFPPDGKVFGHPRVKTNTCKVCKATAARMRRRGVDMEFVDWQEEAFRRVYDKIDLSIYSKRSDVKPCLNCELGECVYDHNADAVCKSVPALA